ncbi:primosomal protein N' (replication factor Y) [Aurantimicrobium minutum]|uniref:primosomal protein N' family DNA-binding protein n=1 Tax=Aurantimicrobium minutum TaxID=708131 RepID=UPI002476DEAD|nr:primosomal protein N' [Aurantimicrobium minutum]MDH6532981.1 primosomal protein N' (replication factor Y) [Aurantimicrobium minutum]
MLLDTPLPQLDHIFEYRVPEHLIGQISPGFKVSVPLRGGSRFAEGYVTAVSDKAEFSGELQSVNKLVSSIPIVLPETLELARQVADRQAGSASDVLRLAVAPRYVRTEKAFVANRAERIPFTGAVPAGSEDFKGAELDFGGRYALHVPPGKNSPREPESFPNWVRQFIHFAASELSQDRSTIISVPDFRDIDLLEQAITASTLATHFIRVDARLSGQERYANYLRSLSEPLVILGNRSAVLAPAQNLGLIVVWDDGDHNFEEPLAPYTHSRDVALIRQTQTDCSLIFASHTRSLEVQRLVDLGWLTECDVFPSHSMHVVLTDADHLSEDGTSARIPAQALLGAKKALEKGPVLIQVASPGFAPAMVCGGCRERARCLSCQGPLHVARRGSVASCRWCGQMASTWSCTGCGSHVLRPVAAGSERTSDEIGRAFPGVQIIVADGNHTVTQVSDSPVIVIATPGAEPRAQHGYSAVLLLDGERLRGREAMRAEEDVLRNWSNTIALARTDSTIYITGAGPILGPTLLEWSQPSWAQRELADRHSLKLPPVVRVASVTGAHDVVTKTCDELPLLTGSKVLGPVGLGDGSARALIMFEYKDGETLASYLRSCVVRSATRSKKPSTGNTHAQRVLRLRVRFDDPDIDAL